jgi:hypothetical protein
MISILLATMMAWNGNLFYDVFAAPPWTPGQDGVCFTTTKQQVWTELTESWTLYDNGRGARIQNEREILVDPLTLRRNAKTGLCEWEVLKESKNALTYGKLTVIQPKIYRVFESTTYLDRVVTIYTVRVAPAR